MPILDGSSYASFVIRLSQAAIEPVAIGWRTESVTAVPGEDYAETSGTVNFLPTETEKTVQVLVYGRAPGDDEPREFRLHLLPSPNVVLGTSTRNCIITVRDEGDVVVSTVTVATGQTGLNAYEFAKLLGFVGTPAEWIASLKVKGDKGDTGDEGKSASRQFFEAGITTDPTVATMFAKLAETGADAGLEAVAPLAEQAEEAAIRSEAARDVSLATGTIFDDENEGRLATDEGDKFRALMPGGASVGLYRNDGATSELLFQFLKAADIDAERDRAIGAEGDLDDAITDVATGLAEAVEQLEPMSSTELVQLEAGDLGEMLLVFIDAIQRFGAGLTQDGTWIAKNLRALSGITADSVASALFAAALDGVISFDERGQIGRSQGGAHLDLLDADFPLSVTDEAGNLFAGIKDGKLYGPGSVSERRGGARGKLETTYFNGVEVEIGEHNYDIAICDSAGHVMIGWMGGMFYSPTPSHVEALLDAEDAAAKSYTAAVYQRRVVSVQKPVALHNALFLYGQSLAQGDETWPALSRSALAGTSMLGGNTLSSADSSSFVQFTSTGLQPLVAQTVNGATRYDAAGEAALAPGSGARGEPPNIGWARGAKLRLNDYLLVENDVSRNLVTINVAKSGATIGELEKGHSEGATEYYGKYSSALTQFVTAAGGFTRCSPGVMFMQGEHDYYQASGHDSQNRTYAAYKAKLQGLAEDMQADAMSATGQAKPPAFLIYQTGASYTRDVDANGVPGMHVGMAQLDFAIATDTAWMVGPVYPYTDKGGLLHQRGGRRKIRVASPHLTPHFIHETF